MPETAEERTEPLSEQEIQERIEHKLFGSDDEQPAEEPEVETPTEAAAEEPSESQEETAPEESAEEEPESDGFVTVEVEGQAYQVPPELKDHILRHDDYTKKTAATAEQRKIFEVNNEHLNQIRQEEKFRTTVQPQLDEIRTIDLALQQYKELDWRDKSTDELVRLQHEMNNHKDRREELMRDIQAKGQTFAQEQERARTELLERGQAVLRESIPGWGEAAQKEVLDHMRADGYTDAEMNNLFDPRHVKTLWKAAQYDKLKSSATTAGKRVKEAPPIVRPKATGKAMSSETKSLLNFKKQMKSKNLSDSDKSRLIQKRLEGKIERLMG